MRAPRKPPTAYDRALRYLALRDHATAELQRKLSRAGHEPEEITAALTRLKALGYLDDERFARSRASALLSQGRLGPRAVAQKLAQAGLPRETVKRALAEAMSQRDEVALAREALGRRHPGSSADLKARARAARFLAGRGFSAHTIARVLDLDADA